MKNVYNSLTKIGLWLSEIFKDHHGRVSSKRVVGILSALCLCYALLYNTWHPKNTPSTSLIDCLSLIVCGSLGLTSWEKIKNYSNTKKDSSNEIEQ